MGNPICFAELHTHDTDRAKEFYGSLFAWKLQDMMIGKTPYTIAHVGEGVPAGIARLDAGQSPRWLTYIEVENVDQKLAVAQKLGAKVMQGATDVPGFGRFGIVIDPTGAEVGFWQRG